MIKPWFHAVSLVLFFTIILWQPLFSQRSPEAAQTPSTIFKRSEDPIVVKGRQLKHRFSQLV